MINKDDWRLTNQENYLSNVSLIHTKYKPYRQGWDHDHCAFCNVEINNDTDSAYCTTNQYHWICNECFNDFKEQFHWQVVQE